MTIFNSKFIFRMTETTRDSFTSHCLCRCEVGHNMQAFECNFPCDLFLCEACKNADFRSIQLSQAVKENQTQGYSNANNEQAETQSRSKLHQNKQERVFIYENTKQGITKINRNQSAFSRENGREEQSCVRTKTKSKKLDKIPGKTASRNVYLVESHSALTNIYPSIN